MEFVVNLIRFPFSGTGEDYWTKLGHSLHDHFIPHQRNNYHPHILHPRLLGLFSALLVCVKVFTLALLAFGPVLPAFSSAITVENIIQLTNESRQTYSLSTLIENNLLDQAAQTKANDMLAKGYFSHNTPDGKTPWDFINAVGYNYILAGENLAVNFAEAENVETAWMNSPEHKANILNKDFEDIGIGIAQGQYQNHTAIFVVQMFGTPVEQKITLAQAPTVVQASQVPVPVAVAPTASPSVLATALNKAVPARVPSSAVANAHVLGLNIGNVTPVVENDQVKITAQVDSAVKVLAEAGQQAVMLKPIGENIWQGVFPLADVLSAGGLLKLLAFDIGGHSITQNLASFADTTINSYAFLAEAGSASVNFLGQVFSPKALENRFYLLFMVCLLSSLGLAIGIKRHIQHLSMITNASFVIILAAMLFWGG